MRFSTSALAAALPALVAAQEPFQEYKAQFQSFFDKMSSYIPNPAAHDPVAAAEAKLGAMKLHTLTLDNWKDTLYEPVPADATTPVEWWVLVSGRNNTCRGWCDKVETAYNQTAANFALQPGSPHMGYLNCDDQPILCNLWASGASYLWVFEMLPPPAPIDVYRKRLNLSTTTTEDIMGLRNALQDPETAKQFNKMEGFFHPFDGTAAQYGIAVPIAYFVWVCNLVPSWLFMLVISMASRSLM
ncbi:hypothetical protein B0I35DRAFT_228285 [Stachybotrys elegans]|uniref:Peptidyl-tRNA hydrolase n=1 Tax=Stachybotrys elegans TaxID=80388 RepID=A0A8K0WRL6_9HYPO|nr:hypothetical protein B0I35DRAFT_228285 [Stachybotrys elegans]